MQPLLLPITLFQMKFPLVAMFQIYSVFRFILPGGWDSMRVVRPRQLWAVSDGETLVLGVHADHVHLQLAQSVSQRLRGHEKQVFSVIHYSFSNNLTVK